MAYLVIVHVPYETKETNEKEPEKESEKEPEKEPDKDTTDDENLKRGDCEGGSNNLEDLVSDQNISADKVESEGTPENIDDTCITLVEGEDPEEKTVEENLIKENRTEGDDSVNEKETDLTETEEAAEVTDKSEIGGDAETSVETESACDVKDNQDQNEENIDDSLLNHDAPLTPLFQKILIHERVEQELIKMGVDNVDMEIVGHRSYQKFSFIQEDSRRCEQILNRLRGIGVGITAGSSMCVFPSSLHESAKAETESKTGSILDEGSPENTNKNEDVDQKKSQFMKSVKSRLLVAQVVKSVTANALFTFDYLLLLILASLIACIGLAENSSVVLVASMLISPLMGPILAATFGQVIRKKDLRNLGLKSEIKGLGLCLIVGFLFGIICGCVGLNGAVWGSTDSWPTAEMKSRGMLRSLWVGILIALPSGAGVAISVLGGNTGSLVGVAISASLLPPACNAGMLWAYSLLAAIRPPEVEDTSMYTRGSGSTIPITTNLSSFNISGLLNTTFATNTTLSTESIHETTIIRQQMAGNCLPLVNNKYTEVYFCNVAHEAAILGLVSLLLTLINICCIIIMGVLVLKIKEVAPKSAGVDTFWREDVQVARGYYITAKGKESRSLGRTFLEEYKKLQAQERDEQKKYKEDEEAESVKDSETSEDESLDDDMAAIEVHDLLQNVENSPDCQALFSKLPNIPSKKVAEELDNEYNEAAFHISNRLAKKPGVYLADHSIRDKDFNRVYNTIHNLPSTARPGIVQLRDTFRKRKAPSMFIESSELSNNVGAPLHNPRQSKSDLGLLNPTSKLFRRRKQKVKFEVTKVDEEQELV